MLIQQLLNGLVMGSTYAVFALGFTLLFGVNHIMNMAYGSLFMWGSFAGLYVATAFQAPFIVSMLVGMLAGGVLSIALDLVAFRPLRRRHAPDFSYILASIGASLVLLALAQKVSNTSVMQFPGGTFPIVVYEFLGLQIQLLQIIIVGAGVVIVAGLVYALYKTGMGRRIRCVAYSEGTARLLGINAEWVNAQVFFISGALAGLAGVLIGVAFNSVHFMMGEPFLMRAFVVIILGGLGSIPGALVGGILIGVVQSLAYAYISSAAADGIAFVVLFLIILIRPTGLFGQASAVMRVQRL
ncbi:branched-chain amino acid ABC transporter permease [Cupriavidus sp. SS-3]|uniref:branched-chain amino acid ABC transporter permease n=1 Tax=Cupriavidus sp. SS-3 TaxID=3109596 RepID=UPI002DB61864|nr:branched-chain amino acid ABC transporter permease [Cupriavidus sp. SS-3]MEC3768828.1 branched-chain amino acid ABC transporter permease [Cupriavidus sp. SS-3]